MDTYVAASQQEPQPASTMVTNDIDKSLSIPQRPHLQVRACMRALFAAAARARTCTCALVHAYSRAVTLPPFLAAPSTPLRFLLASPSSPPHPAAPPRLSVLAAPPRHQGSPLSPRYPTSPLHHATTCTYRTDARGQSHHPLACSYSTDARGQAPVPPSEPILHSLPVATKVHRPPRHCSRRSPSPLRSAAHSALPVAALPVAAEVRRRSP
jgi:hypothetical protein